MLYVSENSIKKLQNDTCPTSLTQLGQLLEQFQNCLLVVFCDFVKTLHGHIQKSIQDKNSKIYIFVILCAHYM
ncbi:hypothetical protein C0J52_09607 [Blattella germanica]|nr:hypothetical protein C0J52_09607 [Blattella germanica]